MALIDYKIVKFSHEGRHVSATVRVYRGSMQDVDVSLAQDGSQLVSQYTRIAKVAERVYEYDVPRDMTQEESLLKGQALLNQRLLSFAQANGHTVITPQQDIAELEAVNNEIVI